MSKITIEVCVDHAESLLTAIKAGADRIELCSALALGGLTPSDGFVQYAVHQAQLENRSVYAMIRPRAGDFLFSQDDVELMCADIKRVKTLGVNGVVVGALTKEGEIDTQALSLFIEAWNLTDPKLSRQNGVQNQTHQITFHRAFDLCSNPIKSLDTLIDFGCERVLTSGLAASAELGVEIIESLVKQANNRIIIMPGAGVNEKNAAQIISKTNAKELHLSGSHMRKSLMQKVNSDQSVKMGSDEVDDLLINVASFDKIKSVVDLFQ